MKNISHIINNVTKKLLAAALVLATVSPFSLDAMKRLRQEGDDPTKQEHAKKQKTVTNQKPTILVCHDGTKISIPYKALSHSVTLKNIVDEYGSEEKINLPAAITSSTMEDIIHYMNWVPLLSNQHAVVELAQRVKTKMLTNELYQRAPTIEDYLVAAKWLDFGLLLKALSFVQNNQRPQLENRLELVHRAHSDEIVMRISSDQKKNSFITSLEGIEKAQAIVNDAHNSSSNGYHMEKHLKMNYLKPGNTLKILKHIKQGNKFVEVPLSEEAKRRILEYLRHDTRDSRRCCYHFSLYIFYGVEAGYYYRNLQDKKEDRDQDTWEVGDIIHFRQYAQEAPNHFAIYLGKYDGDGICLSKLGWGRPLFVNTVESLCLMYRSPAIRHYTNGPFIPFDPVIPRNLQIKAKESSPEPERVESIGHPEFVEPAMVIVLQGYPIVISHRRMLVGKLVFFAGICIIGSTIIRLCS